MIIFLVLILSVLSDIPVSVPYSEEDAEEDPSQNLLVPTAAELLVSWDKDEEEFKKLEEEGRRSLENFIDNTPPTSDGEPGASP